MKRTQALVDLRPMRLTFVCTYDHVKLKIYMPVPESANNSSNSGDRIATVADMTKLAYDSLSLLACLANELTPNNSHL